jgi:hypothetical protein
MSLYRAAIIEEEWALKTLGTLKEMYEDAVNHGHKDFARIIEQGEDYLYNVLDNEEEKKQISGAPSAEGEAW